MKLPCETIRDLIPLVQDDVASASSKEFVYEHINSCRECYDYFVAAQGNVDIPTSQIPKYDEAAEREQAKNFGKKVKKRRILIGTAVAIGVVILLVAQYLILSAGMFSLFTISTNEYSTTDISEYGVYTGHIPSELEELQLQTRLPMFPEELDERYAIEDYYYYCTTLGLSNSYQIYLSYQLSDEDFQEELERLSQFRYDTTTFQYPAYVATVSEETSRYEYVLVDEENNRIICVLSYIRDIRDIPMDSAYLPNTI